MSLNYSWLPNGISERYFDYIIKHHKIESLLNDHPNIVNDFIRYVNEKPITHLIKFIIKKYGVEVIDITKCLETSVKKNITETFIYLFTNHLSLYHKNTIFIHSSKFIELVKLIGIYVNKRVLSWLIVNYQTYIPSDEIPEFEKVLMLETVNIGLPSEIDFFIKKKIIHPNAINGAAFRGLYLLVFYLSQFSFDASFLKDALRGNQTFILKMFKDKITPSLFEYAISISSLDMMKWLIQENKTLFISDKIKNLIMTTKNEEMINWYHSIID